MLVFLLTITPEQYRAQIEQLYCRYHANMLKVAKQILYSHQRNNYELDAEDAVQSAFEKIVRYSSNVPFDKPEKVLKTYIYVTLHNEINAILSEADLTEYEYTEYVESAECMSAEDLGEAIHIRERYREVVCAIENMDSRYSTVLLLYYFHEIPVKQIAVMLGLSEKTIYTRISRGRQRLIDLFGGGSPQ